MQENLIDFNSPVVGVFSNQVTVRIKDGVANFTGQDLNLSYKLPFDQEALEELKSYGITVEGIGYGK